MSTKSAITTPARASHLATLTLSKLLEASQHLTRLHQQGQALPQSLTSGVTKSLNTLREAIVKLEAEQRDLENPRATPRVVKSAEELKTREDLLVSLSKQYDRLSGLCEGLGIPTEALDARRPSKLPVREEQLIDSRDSSDVPLQDLNSHRAEPSAIVPHTAVFVDAERESEQARLDEAEMRIANQNVALMQKRMMDDQDETLDALAKAISRQRDLSLHISSELEVHEGLLEETDRAVDGTAARLQCASGRLDSVARRSRENSTACVIITIIVVLLILVVVVKL